MKYRIRIVVAALLLLTVGITGAQTKLFPPEARKAAGSADERVSFTKTTSFSFAMSILNDLSKRYLNKVIVDPEDRTMPIDVDINQLHWLTALELILKKNSLWYEEYPDYIKIVPLIKDGKSRIITDKDKSKKYHTREVEISAIFFEGDAAKIRQMGSSWSLFRGKNVNLGIRQGASDTKAGLMEIELNPNLTFGEISSIFRALESSQVGEVISSPKITVRSGEEGRIQVGSDIAVTLQDFSGNTITQFFSTGSIIKVKPEVIEYDSVFFINLSLQIERSSSTMGDAGLEIKKSLAKTAVMLLDGEETMIGGLLINEDTRVREGVPILKDLPWWFFGLRYLFGYESKKDVKKELLILLKIDLLPSLEERYQAKLNRTPESGKLKQTLEKYRRQFKEYRKQLHESKE